MLVALLAFVVAVGVVWALVSWLTEAKRFGYAPRLEDSAMVRRIQPQGAR